MPHYVYSQNHMISSVIEVEKYIFKQKKMFKNDSYFITNIKLRVHSYSICFIWKKCLKSLNQYRNQFN